jgi:hypothetical protein
MHRITRPFSVSEIRADRYRVLKIDVQTILILDTGTGSKNYGRFVTVADTLLVPVPYKFFSFFSNII